MQRRLLLLTPLAAALAATGCASLVPSASTTLSPGHWDAFNRAQIEGLIASLGKASPGYSAAKPPYVVFDWDNTSVFLDIEETSLIYQLENLVFSATSSCARTSRRRTSCRPTTMRRARP